MAAIRVNGAGNTIAVIRVNAARGASGKVIAAVMVYAAGKFGCSNKR